MGIRTINRPESALLEGHYVLADKTNKTMCFESTPNEVAPEHTAEVNLRNLVTKNSQTLGAVTQRVARVARNNEDAERGRRRQSVLVDTRTASEKILSAEDIEKMFAWTYLKYPIGIQHFVFFFLWGPIGAVLVVVRLTVLALFAGLMYWFVYWVERVKCKQEHVQTPETYTCVMSFDAYVLVCTLVVQTACQTRFPMSSLRFF